MIIDVKEDWQGLDAQAGIDSASAPRVFTVKFDNTDDPVRRPLLALGATGIPSLYSLHPSSPWLYVKDRNVEAIGPFDYKVTVYYGTPADRGAEEQTEPMINPLDMPWEFEWTFVPSNVKIDKDIDDEPILNSADEPFDPYLTDEVYDLVLRIVRNQPRIDHIQAALYIDSINNDTFYGFSPGIVRCIDYSGRTARVGMMSYWRVAYAFQIRVVVIAGINEGWTRRVLDEGYREKDGIDDDGKQLYKEITDNGQEDGNRISQPVLLDGEGGRLKASDKPVYLPFKVKRELPFSKLELQ